MARTPSARRRAPVEHAVQYDGGVHEEHSRNDSEASKAAVSIHDVAARAQVSIATVSRVMNTPQLVSPRTAERVLAAIKDLGYVPNAFAKGLINRASRVLGIAVPDIHGEFYSELLRGADAEARKLGYHLLISSEAHSADEQERRGSLAFGLIDGLIVMMTEPNRPLWQEMRDAAVPLVVLDADETAAGLDSVIIDNTLGAAEAVEHLLESVKPERCFFVGGPAENFDTVARAQAFAKALEKRGHKPGPEQTVFGAYTLEWGAGWAKKMAESGRLKNAGVLAGNDEIALGIMHAAEDAGVRVPGELKVIGFDDTRLAMLVRPNLSSVRVPMAEAGAAAIRLLIKRIERRTTSPVCERLPTGLVVRGSSGA